MEGANKVDESVRMDCMLEQALCRVNAAALAAVHLGAEATLTAVLYARAAGTPRRFRMPPKSSEIAAVAHKVQNDARKARCIALADGTIAHVAGQRGCALG